MRVGKESMTKEGLTRRIAEFIVETDFDKVPERAVERAKEFLIDFVACALGGYSQKGPQILIDFIRGMGGISEVSVIGSDFKTSISRACLINGALAHVLDYDDYVATIRGHVNAPLLPAVLALGESKKISGKKALESYILGVEVGQKIGRGIFPGVQFAGWHSTPVLGTLASATASAKILNLDVEKTAMTLSMACSMASGLQENFGTDTKSYHAGMAARNGTQAARLVERGFTASKTGLEGAPERRGYIDMFCGKEGYSVEQMIPGRPDEPYVAASEAWVIKPWSSCKGTHAAMTGVIDLVSDNDIKPEDVELLELIIPHSWIRDSMVYHNPKTGLEGRFSAEYCAVKALMNRKVTMEDFTDEKVNDPEVQRFLKEKVVETYEEDLDRRWVEATKELLAYEPSIVRIKLNDGRQFVRDVPYPKGTLQYPMSEEESLAKFNDCAKLSKLPEKKIEQVFELLQRVEELEDITELMDALRIT